MVSLLFFYKDCVGIKQPMKGDTPLSKEKCCITEEQIDEASNENKCYLRRLVLRNLDNSWFFYNFFYWYNSNLGYLTWYEDQQFDANQLGTPVDWELFPGETYSSTTKQWKRKKYI